MRNYSIAGKRGQWPASEDISLAYLTLPMINKLAIGKRNTQETQYQMS